VYKWICQWTVLDIRCRKRMKTVGQQVEIPCSEFELRAADATPMIVRVKMIVLMTCVYDIQLTESMSQDFWGAVRFDLY